MQQASLQADKRLCSQDLQGVRIRLKVVASCLRNEVAASDREGTWGFSRVQ